MEQEHARRFRWVLAWVVRRGLLRSNPPYSSEMNRIRSYGGYAARAGRRDMAQRHWDESISAHGTGAQLKRRGILATAGAVVAGIVARQAAQPVAAGADGDVILGMPNTTANATS